MDWGLSGSYAYALGRIDTRNPTPRWAAPMPTTHRHGQALPGVRRPAGPARDGGRVPLAVRVAQGLDREARLRVRTWQKHDFRTDQLNPFIPGVSSIFLGNDLRNYTSHIIAATLGYRFR